jgi:N-acylglucosamine 2-epimerase
MVVSIMRKDIAQFYLSEITENFYKYWSQYEDKTYGGILNCINNYGDKMISDQKFTWSQGRWLWILARIYKLKLDGVITNLEANDIRRWMNSTYNFIVKHSIYDQKCCYLLTREGEKLVDYSTGSFDASIYADCFALIGMAQYHKVIGNHDIQIVEILYRSIVERIESNQFNTEPYPIPDGYSIHGIPMILVNTVYEYYIMKKELGFPYKEERDYALSKALYILNDLYDEKGLIREHKSTSENREHRLLDRHVNPGHTLEDLWFLVEVLQDSEHLREYLPRILQIARYTFDLGWDKEYGGLFRFVDLEGGMPKGELIDEKLCSYEKLVLDTWDMKLWWPHSEILYLFLLLYEITGEEDMKERYEKSRDYVFKVFPNYEIGEWIQICARDGKPINKMVALPVKDPFHIMRNFIKIVELYGK